MRIVIPNSAQIAFDPLLAKEIGLEASIILLTLEREVAERGVDRSNLRMIARDSKQLAGLFTWMTVVQIKKSLEQLRDRNFIYIQDATLLTKDTTRWYGIHYQELKKLESIVILGDGDIEDLHEPEQKILPEESVKSNGHSQLHQSLFPVVIKMSNLTTPLQPRDAGEVNRFIKLIVKKYSDEDFERLQKRILGMRVWQESRTNRGEHFSAARPDTCWSNWEKYGQYCREQLRGNLPAIPAEWVRETGRK